MSECSKNLWAPWRMEYIRSMTEEAQQDGCFLCKYWADPARDAENHVLWRSATCFVVMNRFPYTNGHLLIAHAGHQGDFAALSDDDLADMNRATRDAVTLLRRATKAQGFNIGYNLGHCAGAGLPDHVHGHIVPRWAGDTNYMAVIGDCRVIPDSLEAQYAELSREARAMGLAE